MQLLPVLLQERDCEESGDHKNTPRPQADVQAFLVFHIGSSDGLPVQLVENSISGDFADQNFTLS